MSNTKTRVSDQYQYLFMGGILGELLRMPFIGGYFSENKKTLIKLGVPKDQIKIINLNSFKCAESNAITLKNIIQKMYAQHKKKIVVVSHSKGCLEIVLSLTDHFNQLEHKIQRVICANPAFNGSELFNKRQNHWYDRVSYWILKTSQYLMPGARCLKPQTYTSYLENAIKNDDRLKKFIQKNLLVIKGAKQDNTDVSWIIRLSHKVMDIGGMPNDGLMPIKDQHIPNTKYQEVSLEIDHSDLFNTKLLSNKNPGFRALTTKYIKEWAESDQDVMDMINHHQLNKNKVVHSPSNFSG
jgi:hypothetical protein